MAAVFSRLPRVGGRLGRLLGFFDYLGHGLLGRPLELSLYLLGSRCLKQQHIHKLESCKLRAW